MIRNAYTPRDGVFGQKFEMPDLCQPDLSFSVSQLLSEYAVQGLPTLTELAYMTPEEEEQDVALANSMETDDSAFGFSDRADVFEKYKYGHGIIETLKLRLKKQREFEKKKNAPLQEDNL